MMGYRDCPKCNTVGAIMCFGAAAFFFFFTIYLIYLTVTQS